MIEKVNADICQKLSALSYSDFLKTYSDEDANNDMDGTKQIQFKLLKTYCMNQIKSHYQLDQQYQFAKGESDGRVDCLLLALAFKEYGPSFVAFSVMACTMILM